MVQKTGPRATIRGVHKVLFDEGVIHGMVICGRRTSAAWSRFRDQNLVLKMGPTIGTRAHEKRQQSLPKSLRYCVPAGPFRRPLFADPRPTLNQPRLAHEAAQSAAPHGDGGRRWSGERGGGSGTRHVTANRAPGPAMANKGGRAFQLELASRQRRRRASAGDSECGAAAPSVSTQVRTSLS